MWFDWEEEAFRYGVDPEIGREDLAALIEGSTVELTLGGGVLWVVLGFLALVSSAASERVQLHF